MHALKLTASLNYKDVTATTQSRLSTLLTVFGIGGVVIALFWAATYRWTGWSDCDCTYIAGFLWRHGELGYGHADQSVQIPYGPNASMLSYSPYFYPPSFTMLVAPLTYLPFPLFCRFWSVLCMGLLLLGFYLMARVAAPRWPKSYVLALLPLLAFSAPIRWPLRQLQPTALMLGILLLFLFYFCTNRRIPAIICATLMACKLTYFLPVAGLMLIKREYRMVAIVALGIVVLNGLGALQTGPSRTVARYVSGISHFSYPSGPNYPDVVESLYPLIGPTSPLYTDIDHTQHLVHWPGNQANLAFIINSFGASPELAQKLGEVVCGLVLIALGFKWWTYRKSAIFDDPLSLIVLFTALSTLSVVIVYHQDYDLIVLAPVLICAIAVRSKQASNVAATVLAWFCGVLCIVLGKATVNFYETHVVIPHGLLILAPIYAWIAFVTNVLAWWMLASYVRQSKTTDSPS